MGHATTFACCRGVAAFHIASVTIGPMSRSSLRHTIPSSLDRTERSRRPMPASGVRRGWLRSDGSLFVVEALAASSPVQVRSTEAGAGARRPRLVGVAFDPGGDARRVANERSTAACRSPVLTTEPIPRLDLLSSGLVVERLTVGRFPTHESTIPPLSQCFSSSDRALVEKPRARQFEAVPGRRRLSCGDRAGDWRGISARSAPPRPTECPNGEDSPRRPALVFSFSSSRGLRVADSATPSSTR